MHQQVHTYEAFKYQWKVWRFTGLDPPPQGSIKRILYTFHAIFLNTFITFLFPVTLIVNCFTTINVQDLYNNLTITVTDIICNLKLLNVAIKKRKLLDVKDIVEKLDKRAINDNERDILKGAITLSHRFFFIFFCLYLLAASLGALVVVFAEDQNLMYPAWIPLNWKESRRDFILANTYQMLGLIIQGIQDVANDTYPQAYLSILCSHIRALSIRVEKIGKDPEKSLFDNYKDLLACIRDHQEILKLYNTIQEIISTACLAQFICSGVAQCTIGLISLYMGFDFSRLISMATFFTAVTLEIYVLCYFGHKLICENEELTKAIYVCNWIDQSPEFKLALIIFIKRSQRTTVIMAGGLIPVNLPTFLKVMKMAYSFFAVINEVMSYANDEISN